MQIETRAAIYKVDNFHSNKNNKDYYTIGLIIEGQAGTFFVSQSIFNEVVKSPAYNALAKDGIPQAVTTLLNLRLTEKGPVVNIDGLKSNK